MGNKFTSTETLPGTGLILLAGLSLLWGSGWPFVKIALGEIPPWTFRTLCLTFGGVSILALAKANGVKLAIPAREIRPLLLVSLLNVTGWNLLSAYGVMHMHAGRAVIIGFTMPVWASILGSIILSERLNAERFFGLGLGMVGLTILIGPDIKALGSAPLGPVFMLGAAVSWAAGTVFIKYFRWTMDTALLTGWQFILGCIPVVIGALIMEPITAVFQLSWHGALATAYVAMLGIPFGWWAWFKVVKLLPASVAAIGTIAVPVIGVFTSALLIKEPVGFQEIVALFCVVVALATVLIGLEGFRRWLDRR